MRITFAPKEKKILKNPKQNVVFGAGLTPKMMQEIQQADVLEISKKLAKKGIPTDFKGNKVIAWCCDKTVEIFEQLNKTYGQKLALPKGIFVEDFKNLNIDEQDRFALVNFVPTKLTKGSEKITSEKTLLFNSFEQSNSPFINKLDCNDLWENIDRIADYRYGKNYSPTDHFLEIFLHEFLHIAHEENLISKFGSKDFIKKMQKVYEKQPIEEYQKKYGHKISQICKYALKNPIEAVACDMSRVIVNSLDKITLSPTKNPFVGTPYEQLPFWQRISITNYSDEERPLNEILRRFWNGKFE